MKMIEGRPFHLYWFSGCGNTLLIALEASKRLTELGRTVSLFPMEKADPASVDASAVLGFIIPVAGQGTYPLVWRFLKGLPRVKGTPCFLLDTLGLYSGGIVGPVKGIVRRRGFIPLAAEEILMPNVFGKRHADPENEKRLTEAGKQKTRQFCDRLVDGRGRWADIPGYSWFMSLFCRSTGVVTFYRTKMFPLSIDPDKCRRCGLCITLCPVGHLRRASPRDIVRQGDSCILCQRCFAYCPSEAITIGNKDTVRYHAVPREELQTHLDGKL